MNKPAVDRPILYLLDGYALIYRAFFAMIGRPLTTSSGENTSAPYGIARFLIRLQQEYAPDYLGVVFDAGDSFRTELLEEYKATREKMPDELRASIPRVEEILAGFRIPVISVEGWEADDVIGTLAGQAAEHGLQTVIVSGDKDFYQLIDDQTWLLNPGRGGPAAVDEKLVTMANAAERLGVPPERVTDYLALIGDSSDNVPGVAGIGPKTAPKLIEQFGDLEQILASVDQVTPTRARNALTTHAEEARLSKRLVTIRMDVPVELELEALEREAPDRERLRDVFSELEFHTLVRDFSPQSQEEKQVEQAAEYTLVDQPAMLAPVVETARKAGRVSISVVGTSANAVRATPVGIALAVEPGRAWYLPLAHRAPDVAHDAEGNPTLALDQTEVTNLPSLDAAEMATVRALLEDPGVRVVGHNLKYDLNILAGVGVRLAGLDFDTSLASYCLDPSRRGHELEQLVIDRFGHGLPTPEEVSGVRGLAFDELSPEQAVQIAAPRADYALRLFEIFAEDLDSFAATSLFEEIEMPLIPVLTGMERAGIRIDREHFETSATRLRSEVTQIKEEIDKLAGEDVNLRSVPQLRTLLFDKLELPAKKRTKTGASTDESVLAELASEGHVIPRLILEHREVDKLLSTYVAKLPALIDPHTGRIHTSFNQTVTATGRLSSSDPNLQNIPIRSEVGREIRKGFIPADGHLFVAADYSQVELRVLAHLSGDPAFVKAFREDRDIHRETAARIFGVGSEQVTPGMRARAKTINFATIYGQGPVALASQLGISRDEARSFIDQYFERFHGVRDYLEAMKEQARETGYVVTLSGRRRYIPEIRSRNPGMRGFGERTATNSPIQGTAADLIKVAMIRVHDRLEPTRGRMLLQVHDELLFEVAEGSIDEVEAQVKGEMESAMSLDVPLKVDIASGRSWFDCKAS